MGGWIADKVGGSIVTQIISLVMVIVALFVFSLLYLAPGDPAAVIAGDQASPEDVEKIFVRGRNETMIPLASLVTVRESRPYSKTKSWVLASIDERAPTE